MFESFAWIRAVMGWRTAAEEGAEGLAICLPLRLITIRGCVSLEVLAWFKETSVAELAYEATGAVPVREAFAET